MKHRNHIVLFVGLVALALSLVRTADAGGKAQGAQFRVIQLRTAARPSEIQDQLNESGYNHISGVFVCEPRNEVTFILERR